MLRINRKHFEAMRRHAEECFPDECCGVLLGTMSDGERIVADVMTATNTRTDAIRNRYHIAPEELVSIQKRGRQQNLDIVGFYHSHPDQPARWSQTDLEEAHWFACSYVITSVEGGVASRTSSFVLAGTGEEDKRFDDEAIEFLG